jgi:hypothetical protein
MKAAPVIRALSKWPDAMQTLIYTGQHYDPALSDIFFAQLSIPDPDVNLEVGSGSHDWQTAEVMRRFEPRRSYCRVHVSIDQHYVRLSFEQYRKALPTRNRG